MRPTPSLSLTPPAEIKADEEGKAEYENVCRRLEAKKADLQARIGAPPRHPRRTFPSPAPTWRATPGRPPPARLPPPADGNQAWIDSYEKDLGPFKDKYAVLVKDIEQLYGSAKEKHAKGIQMLVDEFDYHVAYKRYSDTFSAVPFKPA